MLRYKPNTIWQSIFSTSFFNFWDTPDIASVASPKFWFFLVVTVPFTILVVCLYLLWELRRARRYEMEDKNIQTSLEDLEANILKSMGSREEEIRPDLWAVHIWEAGAQEYSHNIRRVVTPTD